MRKNVLRAVCVFLAAFLLSVTVQAGMCPDGTVVYRQNFGDVSTASAAGVVQGTKNADTFALSLTDGSLAIDNYGDERAYVILPFYSDADDYTVRFSFAFTDIETTNAYFGFMLTCKGEEPSNVTSVRLRASGECDGFDSLSAKLTDDMVKGERVTVTIPVKDASLDEITVTCAGDSETLVADNITDIVPGNIGFVLRNASAAVYEVAVINGTEYEEELGEFADASTWSDDDPYEALDVSPCSSGYALGRGEETYAPMTGDNIVPVAVIAVVAFVGVVILLKKRR